MRTYSPKAEDEQPAHEFDQTTGPKDAPPPTANPIHYLLLFLTEVFIDNIVTQLRQTFHQQKLRYTQAQFLSADMEKYKCC